MYSSQRGFSDYLQPAASMHIQVTSQGQPILVTSSLTLEDPEVNHRPMVPPFDLWNFHLGLAACRLTVRFQIGSGWVWVQR